jgi:hypothetical protein
MDIDDEKDNEDDEEEEMVESEPEDEDERVDVSQARLMESAPLHEEIWPDPCPDDAWCFLCEWWEAERTRSKAANQHHGTITNMINNFTQTNMFTMAVNIQEIYNVHLRRECGDKIWTLNSINNHAMTKGSGALENRKKYVQESAFKLMREVERGNIIAVDRRTKQRYVKADGFKMFMQLAKFITNSK